MAQRTVPGQKPGRKGRPTERIRAEQQRAQETRATIVNTALSEFTAKGYAVVSIYNIAQRVGLPHALATYHFRSKDILWQAVAEHVFKRIPQEWDAYLSDSPPPGAADRVRLVYSASFQFKVDHPEFHRFLTRAFLG